MLTHEKEHIMYNGDVTIYGMYYNNLWIGTFTIYKPVGIRVRIIRQPTKWFKTVNEAYRYVKSLGDM